MKTLLLASVLGLTFVVTSAAAAVGTEETSAWKRISPIENVEKSKEDAKAEGQAWRRIRFGKAEIVKTEDTTKAWRRIRF